MDPHIVDESVDRIARAIFDRWERSPVIEFSEGIEDALFLEAAFHGGNLSGNDVRDMSSADIMKNAGIVHEYKEMLEQFLTNIDKPEYEKTWQEVAGVKGAGTNRTRNRKDAVISASNFLKKFLQRNKAAPKTKHAATGALQSVVQSSMPSAVVTPQPGMSTSSSSQDFLQQLLLEEVPVDVDGPLAPSAPQAADILRQARKQAAAAAETASAVPSTGPSAMPMPTHANAPAAATARAAAAAAAPRAATSDIDIDDIMDSVAGGKLTFDGFDMDDFLDYASLDALPATMTPTTPGVPPVASFSNAPVASTSTAASAPTQAAAAPSSAADDFGDMDFGDFEDLM